MRGSGGGAPVRLVLPQRRERPGVQKGGAAQGAAPLARAQCLTLGRLAYRPKWPWRPASPGHAFAVVIPATPSDAPNPRTSVRQPGLAYRSTIPRH